MGIVYLVQPRELIGTSRYKIGCSDQDNLSRVQSYKRGSRYLCIMGCEHPRDLEKIILQSLLKFTKLVAGREFIEGDEQAIVQEFTTMVTTYGEYGGQTSDTVNTDGATEPLLTSDTDCHTPSKQRKSYNCNVCKLSFRKKSHLDYHLNRKRPCQPAKVSSSVVLVSLQKTYESLQQRTIAMEARLNLLEKALAATINVAEQTMA